MKKIAIVLWLLVLGLIIFTAYNFGIVKGRDFMIECWQENNITYDPNYTYDPNDWVYMEKGVSITFLTITILLMILWWHIVMFGLWCLCDIG